MDTNTKDLIIKIINERVPDSISADAVEFRGELTIFVKRDKIRKVCEILKDHPELKFNMLSDVTAIDWLAQDRIPRFEVVYNIYSIEKKVRLRIKCDVPEEDAQIDSVFPVWEAANFPERETYDLLGIKFNDHPDLRRILMPDDWIGHPLRKDYPLGGMKSFYYKRDTDPHHGEPPGFVPRIRKHEGDI